MTCFVILHYLVAQETINTVNSILKNVAGEFSVIIVDNNSPNDSFDVLSKNYNNEKRVIVLRNSTNAGYAKGINFGYDYAKENLNPSYIVAMNNDMEITQNDFLERIENIYSETGFFVLGPDIYSTSANKHQNPENDHIRTMEEIDQHIKNVNKVMDNKLKLKIKGLLRSSKVVKTLYYNRKKNINSQKFIEEQRQNVTLHGSCFVFSKKFIEQREYALYPKTEFYCESQILDYECLRDKMLTVYDPRVKIYHHEDVATDAVAGSYYAKMLKVCERVLQSLEIFRQLMLEDKSKT